MDVGNRRGWMSERLKESVLKTEVLIGIPGVRIPLHPRGQYSLLRNESDRCLCYRLSLVSLSLSSYRLGKGDLPVDLILDERPYYDRSGHPAHSNKNITSTYD